MLIRRHRACCPGSFSGLMALYEENWRLLQALAPTLPGLQGKLSSHAGEDCELHLDVLESTRYTRSLRLTYLFAVDNGVEADPDFLLRVYSDARQVEAVSCINEPRHAVLQQMIMENNELDRRWRRNIILNKWLGYLLDTGHLFTGLPHGSEASEACDRSRFDRC